MKIDKNELDLSDYCYNIKMLSEIANDFPNDMNFGTEVRKVIHPEFTNHYPNDAELGKVIRKLIKK